MLTPLDLLYSEAHLWVKQDQEGLLLGVTDFAQDSMGELEFLDLPMVAALLSQGDCFGAAETCKSVNDLFAPVNAVVTAVNEALDGNPALVNESPYQDGWLLRVTGYNQQELTSLMDADAYIKFVAQI